MGNLLCPAEDVAQMAMVAQDYCPFPNYNPSPHLLKTMLSFNASVPLKDHYKAVQSSLSPTQLEDFTKRLRTTFGREGKVTYGGYGVVALSLAVLFDTLASKVKGECVSDQEIPRLFLQDLSGSYPPPIYTVSKFLRLVPRIANNPARMRQETERYLRQLITEREAYEEQLKLQGYTDDFTALNIRRLDFFLNLVSLQLLLLTNDTVYLKAPDFGTNHKLIYNLNCPPEVASLAVQISDQRTRELFKACFHSADKFAPQSIAEIFHHDAFLGFLIKIWPSYDFEKTIDFEFDLKAHALGKWA